MINLEVLPLIILIITVIASYFAGNISPAILIGRLHGMDIKKEGSGNAGTTNVLRVLGKKAAVATLVIDILKGVAAVSAGKMTGQIFLPEHPEYLVMACGIAVFCGHIWPAAFGFKGGKGVATAFGVMMAVSPILGLSELAIMVIIVLTTRMVSLGSVAGALAFPFIVNHFMPEYLPWGLIMALIVLYKHNENITRIIKGEESKIDFKNKGDRL